MRAKTANAQNLLQANKTSQSASSSKPQARVETGKGSVTYSLKVLVHKLSLDNDISKELGTRNTVELGFAVKLLEYPTIQITDLLKTTKDQLFSKQGQPRFLDLKIGKSWVFVSDKSTLLPQIDSGHATISVITMAGKELGMAKLALQSFKRFLEQPQQEDNYRRKTFNLYRNDSDHQTGQLELSLSFTCMSEDKIEGARASRLLAAQKPKGFFDESNGSSFVGVSAPQVRDHMTASMLSRNEFGDELIGATVERSAVEAILESKKSKNFFDESEDHSKKSPARPTVKQPIKLQTQPAPSILELAASASMKSTFKAKESKQRSQVNFGPKPVVPPEAARVEMADGAPSVLRPFEAPLHQNLGDQLKQLSKMPGIHEMATQSMYCPPPLFYHKDKSLSQGYTATEGFGDKFQFGTTTAAQRTNQQQEAPLQQNFFLNRDEPTEAPQVLRPTIVLNEKATRSLLSETDLQLALGQNSLLDIVLGELIRLKSQSAQKPPPLQPTSSVAGGTPSPLVRVMLENPQALLGVLHRSASGSEYQGSGMPHNNGGASPKQSPNKKPQNNSGFKNSAIPIGTNESLKDSIFQQSQGKKADRRRDLEKIEEHANSKYYEDEFDAIRDDVQMSLSISQTGPYPQGIKQGNQKGNQALNKKATFDDGRPKLTSESGQADIESQSVIMEALRASESAGALGTRRKESSVMAPREQETGPTIPCVFCKKTILVKDISDHFQTCLKPELKSNLDTKKQNSKTQNQKVQPSPQSNRKIGKNGGAVSPNMKASASYDPYAGSFGDGENLHVSASKSSMLRKSDKEMIQRSESRVKTDYDDEFIDPGTERSEIPDF